MALYSYSRLSTFEQCRLKFRFQYIDKVRTEIETTVEAFLGSMVHRVLERLYKDVRFQKIPGLQELIDFFHKEWDENWNDGILVVRKEYTAENFRKMGVRFITDFYSRYKPFDQARTVGLETSNTAALDDRNRIHIKIDRLSISHEGEYEIHDYKTSNTLPTQEILDSDRQLAIYAYGVRQMYPDAKKIRLIWHYLAFDKELESSRTESELADLKEEILELIRIVKDAREFPATRSALCDWCQFRPICPEFAHLFQTEKLDKNEYLKEEGVALVKRYAELSEKIKADEAELDKVRDALLAYSEKKGVDIVYGEKFSAAVRSYPRLSFPKKDDPLLDAFFETIRKAGMWDELETVNVYELAKKINKGDVHPDILKLLEPFITKGRTIKIYLRRR